MMRVSYVEPLERFVLKDKNGIDRRLKLYYKNGNLYLGGVQALFNRHYVCKDKNRIEFTSKLTKRYTELMHIATIFEKIDKHKVYSNFTKEMLKEALYAKGYTDEDFTLKDKLYTCARENFIEYGFNSMNFCLDRRDDIWVHYKEYEETKQYNEIVKNLPVELLRTFERDYSKMVRFIRYAEVKDNEVRCFALKSINITKLYRWLSDNKVLHSINYVSDIYHETLRELDFTEVDKDNTYVKVIATSEGVILKPKTELGYNC
jgi:hypothetical protein